MDLTEHQRGEIKEMVSDILEISPEDLTLTNLFKEDYNADSLLAIDILASLEKALGIDIPQSELGRMVNLEGVYAVVSEASLQVS